VKKYKVTEEDLQTIQKIGQRPVNVYIEADIYSFTVAERGEDLTETRLKGTLSVEGNLEACIDRAIELSDARGEDMLGRQGQLYREEQTEVIGSCPINAPLHVLKAIFDV